MTEKELDDIVAEKGVDVRLIDIRPYQYALPCIVGNNPILNIICGRSWHPDGQICLWLDTHNTYIDKAKATVKVVPYTCDYMSKEQLENIWARDAEKMNKERLRYAGRTS